MRIFGIVEFQISRPHKTAHCLLVSTGMYIEISLVGQLPKGSCSVVAEV